MLSKNNKMPEEEDITVDLLKEGGKDREIHTQQILDVRSLTFANVGSGHIFVLYKLKMN